MSKLFLLRKGPRKPSLGMRGQRRADSQNSGFAARRTDKTSQLEIRVRNLASPLLAPLLHLTSLQRTQADAAASLPLLVLKKSILQIPAFAQFMQRYVAKKA